jgi:hypothetical protein
MSSSSATAARELIAREGSTRCTAPARCGASSSARSRTRIGRALLAGDIHDGATITLTAEDGELRGALAQPRRRGAEPRRAGRGGRLRRDLRPRVPLRPARPR